MADRTYAQRLEEARQDRGTSYVDLAKEIRAALGDSARGASDSGVRLLFDRKHAPARPQRDVLEAAARVLGVNVEWVLGKSPNKLPSSVVVAEAVAAGAVDAQSEPADLTIDPEKLNASFLEGLPSLRRAGPASWYAVGELYEAVSIAEVGRRALSDAMRQSPGTEDKAVRLSRRREGVRTAQANVGRLVAKMVGAAAHEAGVDLEDLDRWLLDRYIQTTAQACAMLFLKPSRLRGAKT